MASSVSSVTSASIWNVNPEGTGDAPDISTTALLSSRGDVIIPACGTYYEYDIFLDHDPGFFVR